MVIIDIIDYKGDYWQLIWANSSQSYLYKGHTYWKAWWHTPERPNELKNYITVPLPIFTDWWDD